VLAFRMPAASIHAVCRTDSDCSGTTAHIAQSKAWTLKCIDIGAPFLAREWRNVDLCNESLITGTGVVGLVSSLCSSMSALFSVIHAFGPSRRSKEFSDRQEWIIVVLLLTTHRYSVLNASTVYPSHDGENRQILYYMTASQAYS